MGYLAFRWRRLNDEIQAQSSADVSSSRPCYWGTPPVFQVGIMNSHSTACLLIFTSTLALALCMPAIGQQSTCLVSNGQTGSAPASQQAAPADDNNWHVGITPYLWFAGVNGTVGALDRTVGFHASIGDVLSKFNIGFMGAVEARRKRLLLPLDFMWIKLSDDKGIPLSPFPGITSIKVKVTQTVLTLKAGYRIVDHEKLKADGYVGVR